jgi:hypothetical protein
VPFIPRFDAAQVNVVIIGPGLPPLSHSSLIPNEINSSIGEGEGAIFIESPEDQGNCNHTIGDAIIQGGRCIFANVSGSNGTSYAMFEDTFETSSAGEYRFAVYNRMETTAKLWLQVVFPKPGCANFLSGFHVVVRVS